MDAHFKRDSNNLPVSVGDLYSQEPAGTSLDDKVVVPEGDGARSEGDDVVGRSDRTPTSDPPLSEDAFAASEAPGSAANEGILSEPKTGMRSLKEFLRLHDIGRSRVVRKLAFNLGGNFQINVKPKQLPNILFDAVIESSIICVVGFVDISVGHSSDVRKIRQKFSDAERFWETLSDVDKDRFVFHLALMFGPEGKKINDVPVSDMVSQRSGLPFKTEVTLYEYDSKSLDAYPI